MAVREPCRYGERCYRGEAHRAECSHPGDADWPLALEDGDEQARRGQSAAAAASRSSSDEEQDETVSCDVCGVDCSASFFHSSQSMVGQTEGDDLCPRHYGERSRSGFPCASFRQVIKKKQGPVPKSKASTAVNAKAKKAAARLPKAPKPATARKKKAPLVFAKPSAFEEAVQHLEAGAAAAAKMLPVRRHSAPVSSAGSLLVDGRGLPLVNQQLEHRLESCARFGIAESESEAVDGCWSIANANAFVKALISDQN
jgi:hypothetical protein